MSLLALETRNASSGRLGMARYRRPEHSKSTLVIKVFLDIDDCTVEESTGFQIVPWSTSRRMKSECAVSRASPIHHLEEGIMHTFHSGISCLTGQTQGERHDGSIEIL